MSLNATQRHFKVVTVGSIHPEYREILETYFACLDVELVTVATPAGQIDLDELEAAVDERTACVVVQQPNFFGALEDVQAISEIAHNHGALSVVSFDPISLGVLQRPGDLGADIAVAEGQSLGTPLLYGRSLSRHHGLQGEIRAATAGPYRRTNGRPPRETVLGC